MDNFEFDEVILKNVAGLDTLVTYFNKGIFRPTDLKRDLFHYFFH